MEKNTNFSDVYECSQFQNEQLENFRKYKFILCFLLFDNFFMQEDKIVYTLLSKVSLFKLENNIFNFCAAVFNSSLYYDPVKAEEYIKKFYINNKFDKNKFLDINFRKYIGDKLYNKNFEDNNYKMGIILKEIDINNVEKRRNTFKTICDYCKSDDNIAIINLIIIQLIKNYFSKEKEINKTIAEKIINSLYFIYFEDFSSMNKYNNDNENTFFGKPDKSKQRPNLSTNILNNNEKKNALIFDLIVQCVSNYYEIFKLKEKNANYMLELLSKQKNK